MVLSSMVENLFIFCIMGFSLINQCVGLLSIKDEDFLIGSPQVESRMVDLFVFIMVFWWMVILLVMGILFFQKLLD